MLRRVLFAVIPLSAAVATVLLVSAGGSERSTAQSPSPTSPGLLPCTGEDEATNFTAYSLGREFEGLPLTAQGRRCTQPSPIAPPDARTNVVEYIYGDCKPPPDGGCAPPLAVQTWPACERGPAPVTHHNPLHGELRVRGVPARQYEGGRRLEVYTADSTVVVFAREEGLAVRAGRALVRAPARPRDPVDEGDTNRDLPHPPSGPVTCG